MQLSLSNLWRPAIIMISTYVCIHLLAFAMQYHQPVKDDAAKTQHAIQLTGFSHTSFDSILQRLRKELQVKEELMHINPAPPKNFKKVKKPKLQLLPSGELML